MNLLRIVAWAAAAVGAVALSPIAGPVLTVTALGAAVAAGAGAAAAAATDPGSKDPEPDPVADDPEIQQAANQAARVARLQSQLTAARERVGEQRFLEGYITALFAVGTAAAWANGELDEDARAELQQALVGLTWAALPAGVQETIEGFFLKPLSFQQALAFVDPEDPALLAVVDDAIELAILLDDHESPRETAFRAAWRQWCNQAAS